LTNIYRQNPFSLVRLRATADSRQIRRRIEELDVEIQLGSKPNGLDDDGLRRVRQLLESPVDRFNAELLWLHSDPERPSPVLGAAAVDGITSEIQLLQNSIRSYSGANKILATHDLAVLRHAKWLEAQDGSPTNTEDSYLRLAIADWQEALSSPDLIRYFESRRQLLGVPPVEIERTISDQVLNSLALVASSRLDRRAIDDAASLIAVIRSSGLDSDAVDKAADQTTKSVRGEISRGLSELVALDEDVIPVATFIRTRRELLVNAVLAPLARLETLDPSSVDDALRDRVGVATRSVAVDVYNKASDAAIAAALLDFAMATSRSTSTVSQFAAERATVCYQHHSAKAVRAFDSGFWALAAAHAEIAEEFAPTNEAQSQMHSLGSTAGQRALPLGVNGARAAIGELFDGARQRLTADVVKAARFEPVSYVVEPVAYAEPPGAAVQPQRSSRGRWVAAGVLGLILVGGFANANTRSTSTTPTVTSQPAGATRTPQFITPTVAPAAACRNQIRSMDLQLTLMETDITSRENELEATKGQIESLRSQTKSTETLYPRGIPSSIYPSYSASIDRLNAMVADYNRGLATYKARLAAYNELVDRRNALNRSC
jgi:hypothetical protein